jgi:NOL1/NOP2/sun family putative RNA methylase
MAREVAVLSRYRGIVPDFQEFLAASTRPLPKCLWVNTLRTTPEELARRLAARGFAVEALPWYPRGLRVSDGGSLGLTVEFLGGTYHVQEEVSLLPVVLLDPRPGERILDLCAAPGNKTAQAAVHMDNCGTVVAVDPSIRRLGALQYNLHRLGVACCATIAAGGGNLPSAVGTFDRVLVDAPCSCEGTTRKHAHLLRATRPARWERLAATQRALLARALQLCRPGGRVVYSTCTYAPEENEGVLDAVLRAAPPGSVRVLPVEVPGLRTRPGVEAWQGRRFVPEVALTCRIYPHENDTGGFFVAVLEKLGEETVPASEPAPLPPVPPSQWRAGVERYGLSAQEIEDRFVVFRANTRTLALASRALRAPVHPRPESVGLPFLETAGAVPRLTTPAALLLGAAARDHVLELDEPQTDAFLARRAVPLTAAQGAWCRGGGFVLVRHAGLTLGSGSVRPTAGGEWVLHSAFPTAWAVKSGRSLFAGASRE